MSRVFIPCSLNSKSPFFYVIRHKPSGRLYAGYKERNYKRDSSKLMSSKGYQTSSKIIKSLIEHDGLSSFIIERVRHFESGDEAFAYELKFLKRVDARRNLKFINQTNGDAKFRTKPGRKLTEEHKSKISKAHIGIGHTDETKEKLRLLGYAGRGLKRSDAIKQKMRKPKPEASRQNYRDAANRRPPASPEVCKKIKDSKLGTRLWTNGVSRKYSRECPDEGWVLGRVCY